MNAHLFELDTALVTTRTVTRRFREQEGEVFYEMLQRNSHRLEELYPDWASGIKGPDEAEYWVRKQLADWLLLRSFSFLIWQKEPARPIGWVALQDYRPDIPDALLTGFIDQGEARQGIMTEVVLALLDFSFNEIGLEKIRLVVATDNYPAQRLARKCYFTREGDLRMEGVKSTGEHFDLVVFGLIRSDYQSP